MQRKVMDTEGFAKNQKWFAKRTQAADEITDGVGEVGNKESEMLNESFVDGWWRREKRGLGKR